MSLLQDKFEEMRQAWADTGELDPNKMPTVKEALATPDADWWIPRVVSDVVRQAAEPVLVGTQLLQTVRLAQGRSMEFPALGAIKAFELSEGQPYPEQDLAALTKVEGRVSKKGVKINITDEMISDSQWDVIGLHLKAAGRAMARLKEEIIFNDFNNLLTTVIDNANVNFPNSTGMSIGAPPHPNGSFALDDLIDLIAQLVANEYQPNTIVMHPLAWTIFAKDPIMRNAAYFGSAQSWNSKPQSMTEGGAPANTSQSYINTVSPFGMTVLCSPFIPFSTTTVNALDVEVQEGLLDDGYELTDTVNITSIFVIDRQNVGIMLVKEDVSTEKFDNPIRDIQSLKLKERYGITILDDGHAGVVAKNIVLTKNYGEI